MKRVVFIISHIGSDAEKFVVNVLNDNPRLDIAMTNRIYNHPTDLEGFVNHKLDNAAAIYGDLLVYNTNFYCTNLYKSCKFIYIIREAKDSINENTFHRYRDNYYRFRLRRIYEMARETPGAVLLTWDDMRSGKGNYLIEDYLKLKEPLVSNPEFFSKSTKNKIPFNTIERCQDVYEKYLFKLRSLDLRKV